jgi:hypothetical protein
MREGGRGREIGKWLKKEVSVYFVRFFGVSIQLR